MSWKDLLNIHVAGGERCRYIQTGKMLHLLAGCSRFQVRALVMTLFMLRCVRNCLRYCYYYSGQQWESTATDGWSLVDRWHQKTIGARRTKRPSAGKTWVVQGTAVHFREELWMSAGRSCIWFSRKRATSAEWPMRQWWCDRQIAGERSRVLQRSVGLPTVVAEQGVLVTNQVCWWPTSTAFPRLSVCLSNCYAVKVSELF